VTRAIATATTFLLALAWFSVAAVGVWLEHHLHRLLTRHHQRKEG
jgi:hypothetical protein